MILSMLLGFLPDLLRDNIRAYNKKCPSMLESSESEIQ